MIQQQTLVPQRNAEQLRFLRDLAVLIRDNPTKALETVVARHDALLADSEPRLEAYDPRAAQQQEAACHS